VTASSSSSDAQAGGEVNGALQPGSQGAHHRRANNNASQALIERSALGRLRADEQYFERRRHNVSSFGSTWLKPPGIGKSLFQLREERRETEEHAEALRREQLAQELAEAEAANAEGIAGHGTMPSETGLGEDGGEPMNGVDGGDRDLDDEIPDADAEGLGFDGAESSDEDEDDDAENTIGTSPAGNRPTDALNRTVSSRELQDRVATIRATEDRVREMMVNQRSDAADMYSIDEGIDDEDQAQMLEEEDLIPGHGQEQGQPGVQAHLDMEVNLDDDIPEDAGGYEHTDTEADYSSSEMADESSLAVASSARGPRVRSSLLRSQAPRDSLDISGLLSREGSSAVGSSPNVRSRRP
jgi:hypothetical protein